eukprot:TRINITY_DN33100_c0_g1_i1.p1 TRINITY_DN33100_c0_g1~~TRINITY_DN33100_c0_g1_i1.p1  ORF type:complete len:1381 (-),score=190.56 TRINITY_DN33100_c0_g1_i1:354-4496(-)
MNKSFAWGLKVQSITHPTNVINASGNLTCHILVIGAGSSGAVLAKRISRLYPSKSVVLIDAGELRAPASLNPLLLDRWPALLPRLQTGSSILRPLPWRGHLRSRIEAPIKRFRKRNGLDAPDFAVLRTAPHRATKFCGRPLAVPRIVGGASALSDTAYLPGCGADWAPPNDCTWSRSLPQPSPSPFPAADAAMGFSRLSAPGAPPSSAPVRASAGSAVSALSPARCGTSLHPDAAYPATSWSRAVLPTLHNGLHEISVAHAAFVHPHTTRWIRGQRSSHHFDPSYRARADEAPDPSSPSGPLPHIPTRSMQLGYTAPLVCSRRGERCDVASAICNDPIRPYGLQVLRGTMATSLIFAHEISKSQAVRQGVAQQKRAEFRLTDSLGRPVSNEAMRQAVEESNQRLQHRAGGRANSKFDVKADPDGATDAELVAESHPPKTAVAAPAPVPEALAHVAASPAEWEAARHTMSEEEKKDGSRGLLGALERWRREQDLEKARVIYQAELAGAGGAGAQGLVPDDGAAYHDAVRKLRTGGSIRGEEAEPDTAASTVGAADDVARYQRPAPSLSDRPPRGAPAGERPEGPTTTQPSAGAAVGHVPGDVVDAAVPCGGEVDESSSEVDESSSPYPGTDLAAVEVQSGGSSVWAVRSRRGIPRAVGCRTPLGQIFASDGVVVAAGAVGSPWLLMCSGIGPRDLLRRHSIRVVADRPGVGAGFGVQPAVAVTASFPKQHRALGKPDDTPAPADPSTSSAATRSAVDSARRWIGQVPGAAATAASSFKASFVGELFGRGLPAGGIATYALATAAALGLWRGNAITSNVWEGVARVSVPVAAAAVALSDVDASAVGAPSISPKAAGSRTHQASTVSEVTASVTRLLGTNSHHPDVRSVCAAVEEAVDAAALVNSLRPPPPSVLARLLGDETTEDADELTRRRRWVAEVAAAKAAGLPPPPPLTPRESPADVRKAAEQAVVAASAAFADQLRAHRASRSVCEIGVAAPDTATLEATSAARSASDVTDADVAPGGLTLAEAHAPGLACRYAVAHCFGLPVAGVLVPPPYSSPDETAAAGELRAAHRPTVAALYRDLLLRFAPDARIVGDAPRRVAVSVTLPRPVSRGVVTIHPVMGVAAGPYVDPALCAAPADVAALSSGVEAAAASLVAAGAVHVRPTPAGALDSMGCVLSAASTVAQPTDDHAAAQRCVDAHESFVRSEAVPWMGGAFGTCRLGEAEDPWAVADPDTLRVHGVDGLVVTGSATAPAPTTGAPWLQSATVGAIAVARLYGRSAHELTTSAFERLVHRARLATELGLNPDAADAELDEAIAANTEAQTAAAARRPSTAGMQPVGQDLADGMAALHQRAYTSKEDGTLPGTTSSVPHPGADSLRN